MTHTFVTRNRSMCLLIASLAAVIPLATGPGSVDSAAWQNRLDCGLNSLTWAIQMAGVPVPRRIVACLLGAPGGSGFSLHELRRAARSFCLLPRVERLSVDQIFNLTPPFVAHLSNSRLDVGHYVAVKEVSGTEDNRYMWVIDGSTGDIKKYSEQGATRFFTGYVLTVNPLPMQIMMLLIIAWLTAGVLELLFQAFSGVRRLIRAVCFSAGVFSAMVASSAHAIDSGDPLPTLDAIVRTVTNTKRAILEIPGGISCNYKYFCTEDPTRDFAFNGGVAVENTWKWPKLFTAYSGTSFNGKTQSREGVYDFLSNESFARDGSDGTIIGDRHMFTAGFCLIFRSFHRAEGFQEFRHGQPFSGDTIPEILERDRRYKVVGYTASDQGRLIHVSDGASDDIFFAAERSFLPLRRVRKNPDTGLLASESEIVELVHLGGIVWLPTRVLLKEFSGKARENALQFSFLLNDFRYKSDVPDDRFDYRITPGLRMNDLIHEKTYVVDRKFEEPVGYSHKVLVGVNIAIFPGLAVFWLRRRTNA